MRLGGTSRWEVVDLSFLHLSFSVLFLAWFLYFSVFLVFFLSVCLSLQHMRGWRQEWRFHGPHVSATHCPAALITLFWREAFEVSHLLMTRNKKEFSRFEVDSFSFVQIPLNFQLWAHRSVEGNALAGNVWGTEKGRRRRATTRKRRCGRVGVGWGRIEMEN